MICYRNENVFFILLILALMISLSFSAIPVLSTSNDFGAHPVIFYKGTNTATTNLNQSAPQKFQFITKYYLNIRRVGLCLTSTLSLYQAVSIQPLSYPVSTDRFNITYDLNGFKIFTSTFYLMIVTDNIISNGYMDLVVRQKRVIAGANTIADIGGGRSTDFNTAPQSTIIDMSVIFNLKIVTFISSIGFKGGAISNVGPIRYSVCKLTALYSTPFALSVKAQITELNIGLDFIGYTILVIDVDKLNSIGKHYSETYTTSRQTITADAGKDFNIPSTYGPSLFHTNCSIGFTQFKSHNFATDGLPYGGFYFNPTTDPISQIFVYGASGYQQSFIMQIFCFLQYDCPHNQIYVNGTCNCSAGQTLAGNYCTTTAKCVNTTIDLAGAVVCSLCGYGTRFNASSGLCICQDISLSSGCTNISYCTQISYVNYTTSICISCLTNFYLINGKCQCAYGKKFKNSTNDCVCMDISLPSGCTTVKNCVEVSFSSPLVSQCITCAATFTLVSGKCLCSYNTHYNSSSNLCVCIGTIIAGGCSQIPNCLEISFTAWNVSECLRCITGYTLSSGRCVSPAITSFSSGQPSTGGLDNVGLTVFVAVIATCVIFLGFGLLYIIKNVYSRGISQVIPTNSNSHNNNFNQQLSVKQIQRSNHTQSSLQNIGHDEINNTSHLKRKTRNKSRQTESDIFGMQFKMK